VAFPILLVFAPASCDPNPHLVDDGDTAVVGVRRVRRALGRRAWMPNSGTRDAGPWLRCGAEGSHRHCGLNLDVRRLQVRTRCRYSQDCGGCTLPAFVSHVLTLSQRGPARPRQFPSPPLRPDEQGAGLYLRRAPAGHRNYEPIRDASGFTPGPAPPLTGTKGRSTRRARATRTRRKRGPGTRPRWTNSQQRARASRSSLLRSHRG
jgi:hypothetical protein